MRGIKLLVVGWDGADWKVINRLVDEGKMPTIARLIENGTMGNISTLDPPFSPMLWTTIATGMYPFKHGVLGFSEPGPNMTGVRPISSLSRKVKAVWNILTQNNLYCNVLNWWPSHPAEPINGFMISNFYKAVKDVKFQPLPAGTVHPPEFTEFFNYLRLLVPEISAEMLRPLVPQIEKALEKYEKRIEVIAENIATALSVHNAATWLAENSTWDFMAVYFDLIDHMSHGFMTYYPPKLSFVDDEMFNLFNQVVEGTYILQDYMLGHLLELAGEDTNLILLSDHGFHSDHLRPKHTPSEPAGPAYQHRPLGILLLHGPLFKKDERIYGASLLDITPTILYAYDLPIGQDMDGVPLVNAFAHPSEIKTIPSWQEVKGNDGSHPNNAKVSNYDQAEALQQLIDLGYIEKPDNDAFLAAKKTQSELNYNLARSYMFANYFAKAAEIFENLFQQSPYSARFGIRLIQCYRQLGQTDKAQQVLSKLQQNLPQHIQELKDKIEQFKDKTKDGQLDDKQKEQISNLQTQLIGAIKDKMLTSVTEAEILAQEGKTEQALKIMHDLLSSAIPNPGLYNKTADIYILRKQYDKALSMLEQSLELDPENHQTLYRLGYIHFHQGNYEQALDYLLQSVSLVYYNYKAQYLLGKTFMELSDYQRAALALEVCLIISPNLLQVRQMLIDLYEQKLNEPQKAEKHKKYLENPQEFIRDFQQEISLDPTDLRVKPSEKILTADREPVIVVSGIPRSGTSLMMQILRNADFDLYIDQHRQQDENNPRGYFEHKDVKQIAKDPQFLYNLPGKAVKIVSHLLPHLPNDLFYKIIFMERDMDEIVRSQMKMIKRTTGQDKEYRYFQVKNSLILHLHRIKQWLERQPNISVLYVSYSELVNNPDPVIEQIARFLNIDQNKIPQMKQAIDKKLYRTRKTN